MIHHQGFLLFFFLLDENLWRNSEEMQKNNKIDFRRFVLKI